MIMAGDDVFGEGRDGFGLGTQLGIELVGVAEAEVFVGYGSVDEQAVAHLF